MNKSAKIYVAGHAGLVGSALVRRLKEDGYSNLIVRTSQELDLRNQADVLHFFETEQPEYVFLAAAKVGGIHANNVYRADFLYDNLMIEANIIESARKSGVRKLLFLGSSCVYPKLSPQPIREEYLLSGPLEPTNEPYAIAKIAGLKLCETYRDQYGCDFISAMPTNLYGPNDNFSSEDGHVLPALLRKIHEAKINKLEAVEVWGDGTPLREFLHVDDLARACVLLMTNYSEKAPVNIGSSQEISIGELANLICEVVGYSGALNFNPDQPNGTPRKLLESSTIHGLGWKPEISLKVGLQDLYQRYAQKLEES